MSDPGAQAGNGTRSGLLLGLLLGSLVLAASGLILEPASCRAQATGPSIFDATRRVQGLLQSGEATTVGQGMVQGPVSWSLEAAVDPATYRLVPGDLLHLGLWGETPRAYPLVVTPEAELILPDLGPVPVADLTLKAAEERLVGLLHPLYPKARISLRLISPGRFRVAVTGMVDRPGIYEATRTDRLSSVLAQAGGVRPGGSIRRIRLHGAGPGEAGNSEIDLVEWLAGGKSEANPALGPGTAVDVPPVGPTVGLRGPLNGRGGLDLGSPSNVRLPDRPEEEPLREVEWKDGDQVGSLLDLGGGLSERASGDGVLNRPGEPAKKLDLRSAADRGLSLKPGDLLEVGYADRWVFVVGAVRLPGRYPYLPGLRVPDYVNMAGGPTELGRGHSWTLEEEGKRLPNQDQALVPGLTIRVPERRTYTVTTILTPLTSATAFIISVVALARHY